jgi:hypothetical protein
LVTANDGKPEAQRKVDRQEQWAAGKTLLITYMLKLNTSSCVRTHNKNVCRIYRIKAKKDSPPTARVVDGPGFLDQKKQKGPNTKIGSTKPKQVKGRRVRAENAMESK